MRILITTAAAVCVALLLAVGTNVAQDKKETKKEVTLKGRIVCNKCELMKSTECQTVIVVKDEKSKKDAVIFFDAASHQKYHDDICASPKAGTVTGTIQEADKKKVIAVKDLKFDK